MKTRLITVIAAALSACCTLSYATTTSYGNDEWSRYFQSHSGEGYSGWHENSDSDDTSGFEWCDKEESGEHSYNWGAGFDDSDEDSEWGEGEHECGSFDDSEGCEIGEEEHYGDSDHEWCDNTQPPSEVPLPAAVWLFGSGIVGLVGVAARGRRKK